VATRDVFSEDELAQLRGFPEPARAELIRYFTLRSADEAFVRKFRGQDNVLGVAVQLCTLPYARQHCNELRQIAGYGLETSGPRAAALLGVGPHFGRISGQGQPVTDARVVKIQNGGQHRDKHPDVHVRGDYPHLGL
jgi:Domain of unknown function (DUF4158)